MDPASAFSLACGVVQLTELGCKLAIGAKELYQRGSLERHEEIGEQASKLRDLQSLVKSRRPSPSRPLSNTDQQEDQDLITIAEKCDHATERLLLELQKLKMPKSRNVIIAMKTSVKAMRRMSKLEGLQEEIKTCQDALNKRILISLRRKMNDMDFEQTEGFKEMNERMQNMAIEFKDSHVSEADQLSQLLHNHSERVIQRIDMNYQQQRDEAAQAREKVLQQDFFKSLAFPDMFSREEEIEPAYKETYQWIFDSQAADMKPWENFIEWLQCRTGTYWINGKAGSGKSTLMNLVCQDPRTEKALRIWANNKELLRPSFFFWAAGSKLQQSVEGFLRSVIYQLLDQHDDLIPILLQSPMRLTGPGGIIYEWTETKLLKCLEIVVNKLSTTCSICLFADGLDEFPGEYARLIKVIKKLVLNSSFKCCFSSRPENEFEREFQSSDKLQLQDLTRQDIRRYVESSLGEFEQLRDLPIDRHGIRANCVETIVERADGVFLWVEIVVKGQILGIENRDPPELLLKRLQDIPSGVENIYSLMIGKIDKTYRTEAAWYLEMALNRADLNYVFVRSSIDCFCIAKFGLNDNLHSSCILTADNIVNYCSYVHDRIKITCGGLLDIITSEVDHYWDTTWLDWEPPGQDMSRNWSDTKVQFCHRTAKDFMNNNEEGQRFLRDYSTFFTDSTLLDTAIVLARMEFCRLNDPDEMDQYMRRHVELMMSTAGNMSFVSDPDLRSAVALMNYFDNQIQSRYQNLHPQQKDDHWSQHWICKPSSIKMRPVKPFVASTEGQSFDFPVEGNPSDFLSVCAITENLWYVHEVLNWKDIGPTKASQLALCILSSRNKSATDVRLWEIYDWNQLYLLTRLMNLGANPNIRAPTSIWSEGLSYLYGEKANLGYPLHRVNKRDNDEFAAVIDWFLKAGADQHQRFAWSMPYLTLQAFAVAFEVDFDHLPLLGQNKEDVSRESPGSQTYCTPTIETTREAPRVKFSTLFGSNSLKRYDDSSLRDPECCQLWSEEGRCMSSEQVVELNRMLRVALDTPAALKDDNSYHPLAEWFKTTLMDTCLTCQEVLSYH